MDLKTVAEWTADGSVGHRAGSSHLGSAYPFVQLHRAPLLQRMGPQWVEVGDEVKELSVECDGARKNSSSTSLEQHRSGETAKCKRHSGGQNPLVVVRKGFHESVAAAGIQSETMNGGQVLCKKTWNGWWTFHPKMLED